MGVVRYGVARHLEAEADRLIKESLESVTRHCDKADILTPDKAKDRYQREVYVPSGSPDPAERSGMFHRALNTGDPAQVSHVRTGLNSRDGVAGMAHRRGDSLQDRFREDLRPIGGSLSGFVNEQLGIDADNYHD